MRPKRSDYKICEYCGASLDVGERCTCRPTPKINYRQLKNEQRSRYKVTAKVPYGKWGLTV